METTMGGSRYCGNDGLSCSHWTHLQQSHAWRQDFTHFNGYLDRCAWITPGPIQVKKNEDIFWPREDLFFTDPEPERWKFGKVVIVGRSPGGPPLTPPSSCFALLLLNSCAFNRHKLLVRQRQPPPLSRRRSKLASSVRPLLSAQCVCTYKYIRGLMNV